MWHSSLFLAHRIYIIQYRKFNLPINPARCHTTTATLEKVLRHSSEGNMYHGHFTRCISRNRIKQIGFSRKAGRWQHRIAGIKIIKAGLVNAHHEPTSLSFRFARSTAGRVTHVGSKVFGTVPDRHAWLLSRTCCEFINVEYCWYKRGRVYTWITDHG